jgi:TRAP-type mannitol/chloroaromatic compound transport system permease small subunit
MLTKCCDLIDRIVVYAGTAVGWLIFPMCFLVFFDVLLRYLFNSPTIWAWDINVQFLGVMIAVGGAYTLLRGNHVGVDAVTVLLSRKKQIIIELVTSLFFFLGMGVLLWSGIQQAVFSVKTREISETFFAPPLYPLKTLIAVGFLLMFLEGISKFIRNLMALRQGVGNDS